MEENNKHKKDENFLSKNSFSADENVRLGQESNVASADENVHLGQESNVASADENVHLGQESNVASENIYTDLGTNIVPPIPSRQPSSFPATQTQPIPGSSVVISNQTSPEVVEQFRGTKRKKSGLYGNSFFAFGMTALLGGAIGLGGAWYFLDDKNSNAYSFGAPTLINNVNSVEQTTVAAEKVLNGSVTINVSAPGTASSGSGAIISADGYIITNSHVATLDGKAANPDITVKLNSGEVLPAKIVGLAPTSDIAILKIEASQKLPYLSFADSDKLNIAQSVIAVGAPHALEGSVTAGTISSLHRTIQVSSSAVDEDQEPNSNGNANPWGFDLPNLNNSTARAQISLPAIQTDAAINPGNSGGALADMEGNIVGINVAIKSSGDGGSVGLGFAIPANYAKQISEQLIANGSAEHGQLGVSSESAASLDGSVERQNGSGFSVGALVKTVNADSPAAQAGLKEGDIIVAVNNRPVENSNDLSALIRMHRPGSTVTISYFRNTQKQEAQVTLGKSV